MTYRDALQQLAQGADPATVLAEHGLEDVSPEAFSSAMLHFADTAPIETADVFAPINARLSPVPFEDGDLPDFNGADDIVGRGGDVFELLNEVGLAEPGELSLESARELADGHDLIEAGERYIDESRSGYDHDAAHDIDEGDLDLDEGRGEVVLEGDNDIVEGDGFGHGGDNAAWETDSGAERIEALESIGRADEQPTDANDGDAGTEAFESFDTAELADYFDQATEAADVGDLEGSDPSDLFE